MGFFHFYRVDFTPLVRELERQKRENERKRKKELDNALQKAIVHPYFPENERSPPPNSGGELPTRGQKIGDSLRKIR